jgi:hypothetical protein
MKLVPEVTAARKIREVLKTSQGCHTCNRTAQHPLDKYPAAQVLEVPLRKRKLFRVGQVDRYKCRVPRGHAPLSLGQV